MSTLSSTQLVEELNRGTLRVVDLTQPLGPVDTGDRPAADVRALARRDHRRHLAVRRQGGPAWYWNTIRMGEHTGTHFDAPIHWITGKDLPDNACDTIPASRFIGPACVIDVTADVARDPDFLLTPERLESWEARATAGFHAGRGSCCGPAGAGAPTPPRSSTPPTTDRTVPGFDARTSKLLAERPGRAGCRCRNDRHRRGPGRHIHPPFPNHATMHGAGKFGLASLCNLDQLPPTGAVVIAAPLKIVNGSGSPLRVIAITAR